MDFAVYLPSCESLLVSQPALEELIRRLDGQLAKMGAAGEIVPAKLAYLLSEDVAIVESVLDELTELGGLAREQRVFCRNRCYSVTRAELAEAKRENEQVICPQCRRQIKDSPRARETVYLIRDAILQGPAFGASLVPGRQYKMLFAAANPDILRPLANDVEWKHIKNVFDHVACKIDVELFERFAATIDDLRIALLNHQPTLVHFSGHGSFSNGVKFSENGGYSGLIPAQALADLFRLLRDSVKCVVLNACYSHDQASAIAKYVHCVVGVQGEIGDEAAIEFSAGFYAALAAGQPFGRCFEFGANAIHLKNLTDQDRPVVWIDGKRSVYTGNTVIEDG